MSNPADLRFDNLHVAQTATFGVDIRATVTGYATSVKAILSTVRSKRNVVFGGVAEGGGFEIQVKASDFSAEPVKGTAVTCNGAATGKSLAVGDVDHHGCVYMIQAVDFAALDT